MSEIEKPLSGGTAELCLPKHLDKPRLRREHASEYLDVVFGITVAPATLAKLACVGGGPRFHKVVLTTGTYSNTTISVKISAR